MTVTQRRWFLPSLCVSLALAVGIGTWFILQRRLPPMARLAAAAPREARFIEGRISGGFRWAPFSRAVRGKNDAGRLPLLAAADPASRHATAVANLFAEKADSAIADLASIAEDSRDAAVWNDLGAAHYDAASRGESADHLNDALAAIDQALLFNPTFPEALFNRALVLERFHLRDVAAGAWRDYLAHAPSDGWRDEAQRHLDVLTARQRTFATEIEAAYPRLQAGDRTVARDLLTLDAGDARYFAETEGLARWGEAWLRKDPAAELHLAAMRTLAEELKAFNGEALLSDAVSAIESASAAQRDALARGHIGCRDARRVYDKDRDMATAERLLNAAARDLSAGGSPLVNEVLLWAGAARFWQGWHAEAETEFRALLPSVPTRYAALRANLDWLAPVHGSRGHRELPCPPHTHHPGVHPPGRDRQRRLSARHHVAGLRRRPRLWTGRTSPRSRAPRARQYVQQTSRPRHQRDDKCRRGPQEVARCAIARHGALAHSP